MNRKVKIILVSVLLVFILGGAYFAYSLLSDKYKESDLEPVTASPESNQTADFTVTDISGNSVRLSDFFGKPVVVNFWASWCSPCKNELPDFEKVYHEMKNDVVFLMVNMTDGQRETIAKASKFLENQGYLFPVYYDTDFSAADAYSVRSIPMTLFIDSKGTLITARKGMISEAALRKGISLISP